MKLFDVACINIFTLYFYHLKIIYSLQTEISNLSNQNIKTLISENTSKENIDNKSSKEKDVKKYIDNTVFTKESVDILETGKELIKKNNELIKNIEKSWKKINAIDDFKKLDENLKDKVMKKKDEPTAVSKEKNVTQKITVEKNQKQNDTQTDIIIGNTTEKNTFTILNKKETSPIKKLSNLLFKSSLITKSELLNKEDAAVLIENNDKLKTLIGQLQKIFDTNTNILNKFIDGEKEGMESQVETKEKPKDLLKYQVIEITEKKNI